MAMSGDSAVHPRADAILTYWFGEGYRTVGRDFHPSDKQNIWFYGGPAIDQDITSRFSDDWHAAMRGEYDAWKPCGPPPPTLAGSVSNDDDTDTTLTTPSPEALNALAFVVLLDQMGRNIHRGSARAFEGDPLALARASAMAAHGHAAQLPYLMQVFVNMPYMHSESLEVQEECVRRFQALVSQAEMQGADPKVQEMLPGFLDYAVAHRDVVAKWGRFPHRNMILGRESTPEEAQGLADKTIRSF